MIARYVSLAREQPMAAAAVAIALLGTATLVGAWIFQYGLGLPPCKLCLEQREVRTDADPRTGAER